MSQNLSKLPTIVIVLAADVLAAVAGPIGRYHHGRVSAGIDHQLLLAAALQGDEPERGRVDAVAAGGQQPVILVNSGLHALERGGDVLARGCLHGHLAGFVPDHHVVLEKAGGVLGDGRQLAPE